MMRLDNKTLTFSRYLMLLINMYVMSLFDFDFFFHSISHKSVYIWYDDNIFCSYHIITFFVLFI